MLHCFVVACDKVIYYVEVRDKVFQSVRVQQITCTSKPKYCRVRYTNSNAWYDKPMESTTFFTHTRGWHYCCQMSDIDDEMSSSVDRHGPTDCRWTHQRSRYSGLFVFGSRTTSWSLRFDRISRCDILSASSTVPFEVEVFLSTRWRYRRHFVTKYLQFVFRSRLTSRVLRHKKDSRCQQGRLL